MKFIYELIGQFEWIDWTIRCIVIKEVEALKHHASQAKSIHYSFAVGGVWVVTF